MPALAERALDIPARFSRAPSKRDSPMTATDTPPSTDPWTAQLEQLRSRYRHLRPAVLAALTTLVLDENISLDDAKAKAAMRGIRITAASVNAARTILSRMDSPAAPTPAPATAAPTREPRRARAPERTLDAEALIRGFVSKLQTQGGAEADRLRDAMRRAIAVLQAAVG
jgi:hypothetical protein